MNQRRAGARTCSLKFCLWFSNVSLVKLLCVCAQLRLTLCNPMDCGLPGLSVEFSRQEILEWVAISYSKGSKRALSYSAADLAYTHIYTYLGLKSWNKLCPDNKVIPFGEGNNEGDKASTRYKGCVCVGIFWFWRLLIPNLGVLL